MGNTPGKPQSRERQKKYLLLKGAERPTPPGKPYLVAVDDAAPDVLTIRWLAPSKTGGTPLTGYIVEHRRTGSPHWVRAAPQKVRECELTLSGLEPGWRYQFRIFAENLVGLSDASELSEALTVTHQRSAVVAPIFTKELRDTIAIENEKVEFVVHFGGQPAPKICWFKDGFEIFSSRRTRIITEHDRSVLTIHQSAICDEGEVKCAATNKAGHVSTKARLTLEAPPSIRLPRQYEDGLLFEIGELVRLKVSVAGLPRPLVFWSHESASLNESERHEIENDGNSSMMRINEATRNDRGEYQIRAVNKLGTDVASFLVTVTDKPSPPGQAKVVMSLGKSVTLSWNTPNDDGGSKIGNYIIEYYRMGWNVWLKAATTKQLTTILGDLIEGSEYKFRVKAESPFGVSEPSPETEVVFIPDPKRGMLEPVKERGRSQPRDIIDELAPKAAKRKKQPRSQSSSRAEDADYLIGSPPRPARLKLTSPPKTPDFSPKPERKHLVDTNLNKAMFDRDSMLQDLNYGSPNIKIKRSEPTPPIIAEVKQKSATLPTPTITPLQIIDTSVKSQSVSPAPSRERSPSPSHYVQKGDSHKFVKDKSPSSRKVLSRDNSENLGGSTEFMMVLYPIEIKEDDNSAMPPLTGDEDMSSVPPPLSLSAPELGAEPPQLFDAIKYSASSTELLHERAMVRFYQEALAEEEAIQRKMSKSPDARNAQLPKIQINNPDEQDITHLERKHSLRRRLSAGGSIPQSILNTQKRHSLRRSGEFSDIFGSERSEGRNALTVDERRAAMQHRQRSQSEEREEEEFEKVRAKMVEQPVSSVPKKKISVVQEDAWEDEEYVESLSEEESSENESVRYEQKEREISPDEEDETYHPQMTLRTIAAFDTDAPFEILNKPAKLPEPNFVPKPILKKKENGELSSPPTSGSEMDVPRSRSNSLIDEYLEIQRPKPMMADEKMPEERGTSAIASAGLTAAGIIISQPILQKKEHEDSKSVVDHYSEIVQLHAHKTLRIDENPVRAALKKAAQMQARLHYSDEEEEEEVKAEPSPLKVFDPPLIIAPPKVQKSADEKLKTLEKKEVMPKPLTMASTAKPKEENKIVAEHKLPEISEKPPEDRSRGRAQTRFGSGRNAPSKSPHRETRTTGVGPSKSPAREKPQPRAASKTRSGSKPPSRSGSQARPIAADSKPPSRSSSSARPPSRSGSAMRPAEMGRRSASKTRADRKSPSPAPAQQHLRKPKMCEIMTQTSTTVDVTAIPTGSGVRRKERMQPLDETLKVNAQAKVRNTMDYITDLAMFAVVMWVFLFSNELLAIPFLLVAVFRQLQDEMKRWVPQWIKKRWNKDNKE